ncbi:MAG: hypothetical protein ABFC80_06775 [Coriobacteriales bacterium]|nr:hypothetical protein [Actinomycetes bacterium]
MSANHAWLGASAVIGLSGGEKRGLAKYLLLLEQAAVLAPQAPQLVAFLPRETVFETLIDLGLPHPLPERVRRDIDLVCRGSDAPAPSRQRRTASLRGSGVYSMR